MTPKSKPSNPIGCTSAEIAASCHIPATYEPLCLLARERECYDLPTTLPQLTRHRVLRRVRLKQHSLTCFSQVRAQNSQPLRAGHHGVKQRLVVRKLQECLLAVLLVAHLQAKHFVCNRYLPDRCKGTGIRWGGGLPWLVAP